jgi:Lrp/AsnC family transcriptional regulator
MRARTITASAVLLTVVTAGIRGYDRFCQKLVDGFDPSVVTGYFVMEEMIASRPVVLA